MAKKINYSKKPEHPVEKEKLIAKKITHPQSPKHPFEVGKQYQNREGDYHVISINEPNMVIRYLDGRRIESPIALQARIWENIQENDANDLTIDLL